MSFWQLTLHLFNFVLPALALALLMPWAGRWLLGASGFSTQRRMVVHTVLGVLVLCAGLVLQGHDGQMGTYSALVLLSASAEWLMQRGWRAP
jgi:hypothetical protein